MEIKTHDIVDSVTAEGEYVGACAAAYVLGTAMPEPPENIHWPPRKPVLPWIMVRRCPRCKYEPDPASDPNDYHYCPRCGIPLEESMEIDTGATS